MKMSCDFSNMKIYARKNSSSTTSLNSRLSTNEKFLPKETNIRTEKEQKDEDKKDIRIGLTSRF
ncbi:CLUMA_CG018765, isoform A [Clunio marinus]|uniref:CLUMA_CG018765, isoform A n=1 Tax=Clunio marinus TaxID=568069 RepID=A0A1J1J075_9DIPT|nr:CLUMA_CG018765, isoform A [Clunio marinus]